MSEISVVICTHNPRSTYLRRVLGALRAQTLAREQWELLMIDNASTERLADTWDLSWHPCARHVREDQPGLTPARLRAITESKADLLVFVDDDNILAPDFLEKVKTLAASYPYLGVFGAGILEPEFEVPPPPELNPYLQMLALRRVPATRWSNNTEDFESTPWGAGLCVKRRVAEDFRKLLDQINVTELLGRRGNQLFAGEDDVFSWASVLAGQGFGVFPELQITHLISAQRLNRRYFLKLIHDHAFSHGVLSYLRVGTQAREVGLSQYVRLLIHGFRRGWFSMRCQWVASQGRNRAERFITDHHLQPLQARSRAGSST
jgi:glycosyltransferase involved in cell wall biosynthesis